MAEEPINPTLMASYRDVLLTSSAPSFIDTAIPIQPVALITSATLPINVQLAAASGILVPSSTQTAVRTALAQSNTSFTVNVESAALLTLTPTTGKTLYLCGCSGFATNSGQGCVATIYDNTTAIGNFGLAQAGGAVVSGLGFVNFSQPIKIATNALIKCFLAATASANITLTIWGYEV